MKLISIGAGGMAEAFDGISVPHDECDVRYSLETYLTIKRHQPSVVVFTAGVSNPGPLGETPYRDEIETNLLGAFNVATACVALHVETMIFIASVAGLYGKPNHAAYSATKAGIISLVQSLAMEGHNAYAISPGRVDTPMREKDYPNDTPGSRLEPGRIWEVIEHILAGVYSSGDNIMIRKIGLEHIVESGVFTPWKDELRVGQPVTI